MNIDELRSAADKIYENIISLNVNLDNVAPYLPLKNSKWGVIWFDEYYDMSKDLTLLMNPILLEKIYDVVKRKEKLYFYDGKNVLHSDDLIDLSDNEQVCSLVLPFYAFDESSEWLLEFHIEGCNFYGNKNYIALVVEQLGGVNEVISMISTSLEEWKAIRPLSENEIEYQDNLNKRLRELCNSPE